MNQCNTSSQRSILHYFASPSTSNAGHAACASKRTSSSTFTESVSKKVKCDEIIIISDDEEESGNASNNQQSLRSVVFENGDGRFVKSELGLHNDVCNSNEFLDLNDFLKLEIECKEDVGSGDSVNSAAFSGNDFKLNIFKEMMSDVLNDTQFSKLFNNADWSIIERFTCLSVDAQRLFVRLYARKRDWKRKSNIVYKEICDDLTPFLDDLVNNSFLIPIKELASLKTALNLLDLNEIRLLFKEVNAVCNGAKTKEVCINAILDHVRSSQTIDSHFGVEKSTMTFVVLRRIKKQLQNSAFRVNDENCRVFDRMALLFFPPDLNDDEIGITFNERLYTLLSMESGEIRYPSFTINRKIETFKTRTDLINYEESCQIEREILEAIEKKSFKLVITDLLKKTKQCHKKIVTKEALNKDRQLPDFIRRLTAGYILTRCLSHCVGVLETEKQYEEAIKTYKVLLAQTVYCLDYRGKWYERLTINYESRLKEKQLAFETICNAMDDSKVRYAHRFSLYRRGVKLSETLKLPFARKEEFDFIVPQNTIESSTLRKKVNDRKNLFISVGENDDVTILPVEEVALQHYKAAGYVNGVHCEGIIYHAIFGLLFWDIIYYSGSMVKDAFRSRCQTIPLDLNYDTFFNRRKDLILQRRDKLMEYSVEEINNELEKAWNENYGCKSLVNWEVCDLQQLKEIVICSRGGSMIDICTRMARDFRHCRSGFPDLLLWNAEKGMIMAVEVKGPGDVVSPKQALWINFFNEHGLTAEVCHVVAKKV